MPDGAEFALFGGMFWRLFLSGLTLLAVVFANQSARAQTPPLRAEETEFDFKRLMNLIDTHKLTRIEDVIEKLPESLRSSYTLMHTSGSLQFASMTNPRVILFGYSADFIVTFTGEAQPTRHNSDGAFYSIETFEFQRDTNQRILREVVFDPKGILPPQASEPNPTKCLSCHTHYALPIWTNYNRWTGAYGEVDDRLSLSPNPTDHASTFDRLLKWKAAAASHPRYKHLAQELKKYPRSKYHFPYIVAYDTTYDGFEIPAIQTLEFTPNARLASLLAEKVARSNSATLLKSKNYPRYQYQIARRCYEELLERYHVQVFRSLPLGLFDLSILQMSLARDGFSGYYRSGFRDAEIEAGMCRDVIEDTARRMLKDSLIEAPLEIFREPIVDLRHDTPENSRYNAYEAEPKFLEYINKHASQIFTPRDRGDGLLPIFARFADAEERGAPLKEAGKTGLLLELHHYYFIRLLGENRCIECHSQPRAADIGAPFIPFESTSDLIEFMNKDGGRWRKKIMDSIDPDQPDDRENRMPPRGPYLPPAQAEVLRDYFKNLSNEN